MTTNKKVLDWVEEMKALVKPDKVVWIDGSEAQLKELRDQALATGEMEALNPEKLPGCLLHRCQRCGPGGGPYLHLLPQAGGCRPHQQLGGPGGHVRPAAQAV